MSPDAQHVLDATFNNFNNFVCNAAKRHNVGRYSGGISVSIRKNISSLFQRVYMDQENCLFFKLTDDSARFDIYIGFVYIHPERSPEYTASEDNGIDILENKLLQVLFDYGEASKFILFGDFNARTASEPDFIVNDGPDYIPVGDDYAQDNFDKPRSSYDTVTNTCMY